MKKKKKKENVIWLTIFTPTDLIESESESELPSSPSYSSWFRKHIKKVVMYLSVMSSVKDKNERLVLHSASRKGKPLNIRQLHQSMALQPYHLLRFACHTKF